MTSKWQGYSQLSLSIHRYVSICSLGSAIFFFLKFINIFLCKNIEFLKLDENSDSIDSRDLLEHSYIIFKKKDVWGSLTRFKITFTKPQESIIKVSQKKNMNNIDNI